MRYTRPIHLAVLLALALAPLPARAAADGIVLRLARDAGGNVVLTWTGSGPAYRILRDAVVPPAVMLADTVATSWSEPLPASPLLAYEVRPVLLDVALTVEQTGGVVVSSVAYPSSTTLLARWLPSAADVTSLVDHCVLLATESLSGSSVAASAAATDTSALLSGLRSDTSYVVEIRACLDPACAQFMSPIAGPATAATPQEAWQLDGTGSSVATLKHVVADGNVKIHAFRYGPDAPPAEAGKVQIYYGPMGASVKGIAVGVASLPATTQLSTVDSFTSLAGASGLIRPTSAAPLVADVATAQAVPLMSPPLVRLYFEAPGADGKTRIQHVDSRDGWVGQDFNSGPPVTCATAADYDVGGGCETAVAIGVAGDPAGGNAGIPNARQFKIGFPTLADWRWDQAAGTFMLFTTDPLPGCSPAQMNQVYATYTGSAWQVERQPGGCPKLFASVQAPAPLHLGGARYKLYFGDPSIQTGRNPSSPLPFLGPKKILYADGVRTGDPDLVEYEDWDTTAQARGVVYLWPSGAPLDDKAEGYIDDFSVISPTASLDFQVIYVAITDSVVPPFAAIAVLVNP